MATAATEAAVTGTAVMETVATEAAVTEAAVMATAVMATVATEAAVTGTAVMETVATEAAVTEAAVMATAVMATVATEAAATEAAVTGTVVMATVATEAAVTEAAVTGTVVMATVVMATVVTEAAVYGGYGGHGGSGGHGGGWWPRSLTQELGGTSMPTTDFVRQLNRHASAGVANTQRPTGRQLSGPSRNAYCMNANTARQAVTSLCIRSHGFAIRRHCRKCAAVREDSAEAIVRPRLVMGKCSPKCQKSASSQ